MAGYGHKQTEETRLKISLAKKGKVKWWIGRKHTKESRERMSLSHRGIPTNRVTCRKSKEYYRKIGLKGLIKQQNMKQPTNIEKLVYDFLILKGIVFEKQYEVNGRFIVDVYIPSLNTIIEADGKYWHSLPHVVKKDNAENAYLKKCGFNVIRLAEEEILSGKFKEGGMI